MLQFKFCPKSLLDSKIVRRKESCVMIESRRLADCKIFMQELSSNKHISSYCLSRASSSASIIIGRKASINVELCCLLFFPVEEELWVDVFNLLNWLAPPLLVSYLPDFDPKSLTCSKSSSKEGQGVVFECRILIKLSSQQQSKIKKSSKIAVRSKSL